MSSSGGSMTYEQAQQQAIQLKKQGMTYPKIEEHFRNIGYKSAKTKDFVGALAIRHMVTSVESKAKKESRQARREDEQEEKMMAVTGAGFRETVRKLAEVPGIDEGTFLNLIKALMTQHDRQGKGK